MATELDIRTAETVSAAIGSDPRAEGTALRQALDAYTEKRLVEVLNYAKANSIVYAGKLDGIDCSSTEAMKNIPFTTPEELRQREKDFLCVRPSEISRIVTLHTSGTTGRPKRIYFTEEDQQLTVDFFNHGMRLIVDESDTVLILMQALSEGSVGKLLGKGLREAGVRSIEYGLPFGAGCDAASVREEAGRILQLMRKEGVTSIVAMPTHMAVLAKLQQQEEAEGREKTELKSVLLSAEFVPEQTVRLTEDVFQCRVFEHYGMTEMGLGCAVSCGCGKGYHIREADIFIELIEPVSGQVITEEDPGTPGYSRYGEIVFTTLTRAGMPFIRYRTGDRSRWIFEECSCGSCLKRLDRVVPEDGRN